MDPSGRTSDVEAEQVALQLPLDDQPPPVRARMGAVQERVAGAEPQDLLSAVGGGPETSTLCLKHKEVIAAGSSIVSTGPFGAVDWRAEPSRQRGMSWSGRRSAATGYSPDVLAGTARDLVIRFTARQRMADTPGHPHRSLLRRRTSRAGS